jgi:hypothetical protein
MRKPPYTDFIDTLHWPNHNHILLIKPHHRSMVQKYNILKNQILHHYCLNQQLLTFSKSLALFYSTPGQWVWPCLLHWVLWHLNKPVQQPKQTPQSNNSSIIVQPHIQILQYVLWLAIWYYMHTVMHRICRNAMHDHHDQVDTFILAMKPANPTYYTMVHYWKKL